MQSMFYDQKQMKLEINSKGKFEEIHKHVKIK